MSHQMNLRRSQSTGRRRTNTDAEQDANCGLLSCQKPVKIGIECTNCEKWFHPACASVPTDSFRKHLADEKKPWFCSACKKIPFLKSLCAVVNYYEGILSTLRDSIQTKHPTPTAPFTPPVQPTRKRPRTTGSPIHSGSTHQPSQKDVSSEPYVTAFTDPIEGLNPNQTPGPNSRHHKPKQPEPLTVICSFLPEPTETSLAARRQEEDSNWSKLCLLMGINVTPTALTRLTRKPDSLHANEPRLLRVSLSSMEDVERVLLAAHLLPASTPNRIYPDVPWTERVRRRNASQLDTKDEKNKRAIFIHGVPELPDQNPRACYQHDCGEWLFIQGLIGIKDTLTTEVVRLPTSTNYRGSGPRILKVTLMTTHMVDQTLEAWYANRSLAPPELRLRPSTSRTVPENALPTPSPTAEPPSMILSQSPNPQQAAELAPLAPKNDQMPAQQEPGTLIE